ncbi:MOSC domain-containing protein [Qipengyuania sediminis]|uniref:MOSC domain-containing protein n=1 Tax=Qipengyuania sediminis TaxID=1532023 RepID=UPI001F112829|nr:MOSC domain-containing protein [Qipengyuania sediminis]
MNEPVTVAALMTGRIARLPGGKRSAIAKHPVAGPVAVTRLGLAGDRQANRRHHGGPEMVVHLYPRTHHRWWKREIGDHSLLADPGAFGSNLAIDGIDERDVCIGERFRLGSALLEVSQPRKPCATIEQRFERGGMVAAIISSGRCGWYMRVIAEGIAEAGDALVPVVGSGIGVTVREAFAAAVDPAAAPPRALLADLAAAPALADEWRARIAVRLARLAKPEG